MRTVTLEQGKLPTKPILVYDGDCNFCRYWASRWKQKAGNETECIALQDGQIASRFPEIPHREWESAVHLIDTTGAVYSGAEAVFRFQSRSPAHRLLLKLYVKSKVFAALCEAVYMLVARNRSVVSWVWGTRE